MCCCNWRVKNLYLIAESQKQAEEILQGAKRVLVYNSYLRVIINGVKRQEISARVPYQQSRYVLTLEQIAYARENYKVTLLVYNGRGAPVQFCLFPIAFIVGQEKHCLLSNKRKT